MRILKNIWAQLHRFVFWALILSVLWAWIYTFVGDTTRDKKLMLYVDAYALERRELAIRLEDECLPEGIKKIQVRSFDYDIFGGEIQSDLYLMKESILRATLEQSPEKLAPLTPPSGKAGYEWEGKCWGILVFDPATQRGSAMDYIQYAPLSEPEQEAYYLCVDAASPHYAANHNALDNAAWEVALALMKIN